MKQLICNVVLLCHLYSRTVQTDKLARLGYPVSLERYKRPHCISGWQHQNLRLGHPLSLERYKRLHSVWLAASKSLIRILSFAWMVQMPTMCIWLTASKSPTWTPSFARTVQTPTVYIWLAVSDSLTRTSCFLVLPLMYTLCFNLMVISYDIWNKFSFSRYMYRLYINNRVVWNF